MEADTGPGTWVVHCDGSAVPNPGRMAYGAVIVAPDGTRSTLSRASTEVGCNNEAELWALTAALHELRRLGAESVLLHSDNRIVVDQLGGAARQPAPVARLADLFEAARVLIGGFASIRLQWVPRHRNAEADALARAAQGLPAKAVKPPGLSKARRKSG